LIAINSYFSGAGLFDIGIKQAGLEIQQSFEIDPVCCQLQKQLGGQIIEQDISKKLVADEMPCDVMVATYPCTKYSTAADLHGTRTGDELFLHFFRHIAIRKPEIYVVENVPGMKKFPVVMEAMTRLPDYYVSVFCPVQAEDFLPQRRRRLIIIGSKRQHIWQAPQSKSRVRLADIIEHAPIIDIPEAVLNRLNGKYRDQPIISDPEADDLAPTCVAHYHKDRSTRLVKDRSHPLGVRPYTVREYARLQGVPDWFKFDCPDNAAYKAIGNGVPVPFGRWVGGEIKRYFQ
jgi:DNA (cytosine-5)-methyltransferase 1